MEPHQTQKIRISEVMALKWNFKQTFSGVLGLSKVLRTSKAGQNLLSLGFHGWAFPSPATLALLSGSICTRSLAAFITQVT